MYEMTIAEIKVFEQLASTKIHVMKWTNEPHQMLLMLCSDEITYLVLIQTCSQAKTSRQSLQAFNYFLCG